MPRFFGRFLWGLAAGLIAATVAEGHHVLIGRNFRPVIPGHVYRCAQLTESDLAGQCSRLGVRTVINLRGCWPTFDWYDAESRATASVDITQEDLTLSAGRLPAPCEIRRLVEILDQADYPLLIHCRRGVDRTGLASAIASMLYAGATPAEARGQLSPRYGHVSLGRTEAMLRFFDLYESWLQHEGVAHSPTELRRFAASGYAAGPSPARLELLSPSSLQVGGPQALKVRATNLGADAWHLRPGTGTGIHLRFRIADADRKTLQAGTSGLFLATVPPGQSIELTLVIDALPRPGQYTLSADMYETPDISFAMLGSEPLEAELHVP
ncbi:MAG: tyrosine-protein phosphatase [Gemmataceae bacterium]|nr:tyrosine-protein phosphatase [Gemmataceae bacterium]